MRREMKQTIFCALLLGSAAAAAPFLCLLPIFNPTMPTVAPKQTAAPTAAPGTAPPATPAATVPPTAEPPLLLYDKDSGGTLEVPVQEYLIGAAACELPPDAPEQALCAQMVASHSYALYCQAHGGATDGACIEVNRAQCSGWTDSEVLRSRWGDTYTENYERLQRLAAQVEHDILLYDGAPAATFYHAVSCGRTEASEIVWGAALPYLQGVDSAWDRESADYEVTVQFTAEQLSAALTQGLGLSPTGAEDSWFGDTVWDTAGYVRRVTVCGQRFSGVQLRSALGLRSACFSVAWRGGMFVVTTRGYGHGVGLSQYGACSMARGGAGWQDILSYYFPGTTPGTAPEDL